LKSKPMGVGSMSMISITNYEISYVNTIDYNLDIVF